jgi:putative transposase
VPCRANCAFNILGVYHGMSRGIRRGDIFLDDVDRRDFLKTLAEACRKTEWQVHAYCLTRNHYPRVVRTPGATLVTSMVLAQSTYTTWLNRLGRSRSASVRFYIGMRRTNHHQSRQAGFGM